MRKQAAAAAAARGWEGMELRLVGRRSRGSRASLPPPLVGLNAGCLWVRPAPLRRQGGRPQHAGAPLASSRATPDDRRNETGRVVTAGQGSPPGPSRQSARLWWLPRAQKRGEGRENPQTGRSPAGVSSGRPASALRRSTPSKAAPGPRPPFLRSLATSTPPPAPLSRPEAPPPWPRPPASAQQARPPSRCVHTSMHASGHRAGRRGGVPAHAERSGPRHASRCPRPPCPPRRPPTPAR